MGGEATRLLLSGTRVGYTRAPVLSGAVMLGTAPTIVRLSLHVSAAAVWVGGQLTLGGLVPTLRRVAPESTTAVARQFARLAWPAYAVLVGTGIWNVVASHASRQTDAWKAVLAAKIAIVVLSGAAAFAHQRARGRAGLAVWGALAALSSLSALVLGVALSG